jgi:hypothetical protein
MLKTLLQVLFQYAARHAPMTISDIIAAVSASDDYDDHDKEDAQMLDSV